MKILIVEDNEKIAKNLKQGFEQEGFAVECIFDGAVAEKRLLLNRDEYDIVVLDLMLPGKDGIELCDIWRERGIMIPILMLTARDRVDDKVRGLSFGADDYLPKPFAFEELLARIRALLRRPATIEKDILTVSDISLDTVTRKVTVDDEEVILTLKEFMVLELLMRNKGRVLTRDDLYSHAWDHAESAFSNTVNVHIRNLREKLHDDTGTRIQTVRGVGYRMEA